MNRFGFVLYLLDDVRVGDDLLGRDRKAGAVRHRRQLVAVLLHDYHPHHAARGGVDVRRIGMRREATNSARQARQGSQKAKHRRRLYGTRCFERKRREARGRRSGLRLTGHLK